MIVLKNIHIILFSIIICSHALAVEPRTKLAVQVERLKSSWLQVDDQAPEEVLAIGKVLKEWFENCAAGELEEVKKAYLPSVNKKAERDLQQIERFLEVVPDWQFSLLGVMWDGNKATAVSNVLKGLKDPSAIISGPVVWICHLKKLDGQWWLANNVAGERLEKFQQYVAQSKEKNPNLNMWLNRSYSSLLQETNVLKDKAEAFEKGEWKQLDGAPKEAQDIGEILRRWFGGCLAGDLEQVKATYTPNNRRRAEKQLKEIREHMTMTPADWQFSPMIIKIGDSRAEAISHEFVITFNHPENTGDPAVLIVHLMKVDAQWGILYSSGDLLRNVSYAHFKRKYPQSRIWFDKSIPDWLKPDQQTKTGISIEDITSSVPEIKAELTLAEKLRELNNDREIFESYFPDSTEGGKVLDDWWKVKDKEQRSDEEIVSIIRNGLRRAGNGELRDHKDRFTGWIGQKYIWKKGPKNKQVVELMYYASFDPDLTANTVYYGLSVAGDEQSPKVLKRLVDICMSNIYVTRILWGTKGKHDRMIEYLEPYLNSSDQQICQRAVILEKALKGEIDYGQWEKEQYRKKRQEEFGDQLPQIREVLLKGNSKQRSEIFDLIRRKGLYILVEDSFKEPLIACLKDDHPVVKEAALRLSGGVLLKKNEQSPDIFELMINLSRDWDHKVRNEAAKFIGGHWIWGAKPQKPEAIEIMLRLSKDKDRGVRYQAVYYGLSVVENKDERVIKRLVEMALDKTNDFGRIGWGLGHGADKEMIKKYLKPYIDIKSKKGELARQLYKEIFKEELPEI